MQSAASMPIATWKSAIIKDRKQIKGQTRNKLTTKETAILGNFLQTADEFLPIYGAVGYLRLNCGLQLISEPNPSVAIPAEGPTIGVGQSHQRLVQQHARLSSFSQRLRLSQATGGFEQQRP